MVLYFVVKVNNGYAVWEMADSEMYNLTKADPALLARLDHVPFKTEAEQRRNELLFASAPLTKKNQQHTIRALPADAASE